MRFNKHIAVIFAFYYLFISVGLAVNLHYCGGELESISSIFTEASCEMLKAKKGCCLQHNKVNNDCCSNQEIGFTDVDKDTLLTATDTINVFALPATFNNISTNNLEEVLVNKPLQHYTFQSNAPPLFKLYSSYILYA